MNQLLLIVTIIFLLGCTHTIPPQEAKKQLDIQTEIFQKSSANGEYQNAIDALHKIIDINQKGNLELYEADMYYYLAELYFKLKNYPKAIEFYKKTVEEYKAKPNRIDAYYLSIAYLGRLYMMEEKYKESLFYHKKAITLLEENEVKDKNFQFTVAYGNIAILYQENGEYVKALEFNQKALDILLEFYPEKLSFIATTYNNISAIKNDTGDYPSALKYLKKSLAIHIKEFGKKNPILSSIYHNMAIHYLKVGNSEKAQNYLKQAFEVRNKTQEDKDLANLYATMGGVSQVMKDYDKSRLYYEKSINLYKKLHKENSISIALTYLNFGQYYEAIGNLDQAMNYYQKAQKIERSIFGEKNLIVAEANEAIGIIYMAKGQNKKALTYMKKVLSVRKELLGEENSLTKKAYENIGGLNYNQENHQSSYVNIKKSFDFFMKERERFFSILDNEDKKSYIKENRDKVLLLFESASELRDEEIASLTFDDWINYKGTLFDKENELNRVYEQGDDTVRKKIDNLRYKKQQLAKLYQEKLTGKKEKIQLLEDDISMIEIELNSKFKKKLNRLSQRDISKNLKKSELYIDYAKLGKRYFVFTLDSDNTLTFYRYSMEDSNNIGRLVMAIRKDIRQENNREQFSSQLYTILMKYVNFEKKSFIISSDGLLRLLPFEILYNSQKKHYLIEDKEIRYIPSGKEFVRLYGQPIQKINRTIAIFSNPNFEADISATHRGVKADDIFKMKFNKLPQTELEAEAIKTIFFNQNIRAYSNNEASESNLLSLENPKILHIATHGFFLNSNLPNPMLKSGIALSGANKSISEGRDDGIVTALKLSGLHLKNTELVVLSACKTGIMDLKSTDNISGLNKAFIHAGATNVVVSLWSVSDEGTKELMKLFYEEVAKGKSYSQSLNDAKLKMIKFNYNPFVWASFIIHGL